MDVVDALKRVRMVLGAQPVVIAQYRRDLMTVVVVQRAEQPGPRRGLAIGGRRDQPQARAVDPAPVPALIAATARLGLRVELTIAVAVDERHDLATLIGKQADRGIRIARQPGVGRLEIGRDDLVTL